RARLPAPSAYPGMGEGPMTTAAMTMMTKRSSPFSCTPPASCAPARTGHRLLAPHQHIESVCHPVQHSRGVLGGHIGDEGTCVVRVLRCVDAHDRVSALHHPGMLADPIHLAAADHLRFGGLDRGE